MAEQQARYRGVELGMAWDNGQNGGTWSIERVLIPFDTDDAQIEQVAQRTYENTLTHPAAVQIVSSWLMYDGGTDVLDDTGMPLQAQL